MNAGLVRSALPFAAGACLLQQMPELPSVGLMAVAGALAALLAWRVVLPRWLPPLLFGLLWAWGHAYWQLSNRLPEDLQGRDLEVHGQVVGLPASKGEGLRFLFELFSVQGQDFSGRVRLNWYRDAPELRSGEVWRLRVRLKTPHGFANPGGLDYEGRLFRQGIRATGYVRRDGDNRRLETLAFSVDQWRERLADALDRMPLEGPAKGLVPALVLGDRGGLQRQDWEVLTRTGTNHLMAISGLHVGIMAGLAYFLMRWLWRRSRYLPQLLAAERSAALAGMSSALAYSALAGFAISTQRALIMLCLVFGAVLLRRVLRPAAGLAAALGLVVLYDPFACLSPGFWLSFAAVAVLLFGMSRRAGKGGLVWRWGRAQWLVALGLLPLLLLLFGRASPAAPVVNLIAVPLFSLLLPLVLGSVAAALALDWLGPLQGVAWLLNQGYEGLAVVAAQTWSQWVLPQRPLWTWACAFLGALLLLMPRGLPARWTGLVFMLPLFILPVQKPAPGEYRFTLLDVGQGLSAVVQTHRHVLVFDTGPAFSSGFNTGSAVVLPFLRARGIERVETLVLSHADTDHAGGARDLLAGIPVDRVLSGEPEKLGRVPAELCRTGMHWRWDGVDFRLFSAQRPRPTASNDRSCALKISNGNAGVLLTGDLGVKVERWLADEQAAHLPSAILVAGHHGSATSSSERFLDAVDPEYVLFAAGYRNRYGFPHPVVKERVDERGAIGLNTADTGAMEWLLPASGPIPRPRLRRVAARRYWTHRTPVLVHLESGYH